MSDENEKTEHTETPAFLFATWTLTTLILGAGFFAANMNREPSYQLGMSVIVIFAMLLSAVATISTSLLRRYKARRARKDT